MVHSTAVLVAERGARATSIDAILEHSGAPRGSVYHHFPGGRGQLLTEATALAAEHVENAIDRAPGRPEEALAAFLGEYRKALEESDFRAGCPVAAVVVEADSGLRGQAAVAFASWRRLLAARLREEGCSAPSADRLAVHIVAAVEGAVLLCRAEASSVPLAAIEHQLNALIRSETGGGAG